MSGRNVSEATAATLTHSSRIASDCFATELEAVKIAQGGIGLKNVENIIPFTHIPDMEKDASKVSEKSGLERAQCCDCVGLVNPVVCFFQSLEE